MPDGTPANTRTTDVVPKNTGDDYQRPWWLKLGLATMLVMAAIGFPLGLGNIAQGNLLLAGGIYLTVCGLMALTGIIYIVASPEMINSE